MMTVIHQDSFHPMRGHVAHGAKVLLRNGQTVSISATNGGWQLKDSEGRNIGEATNSANDLAWRIDRL